MLGTRLDQLGWSQAEFSRRTRGPNGQIRISQTAVTYWFNSEGRPSPDSLKIVAEVTGLDLGELMAACGYGPESLEPPNEPDDLRRAWRRISEAYPQAEIKDQEWTRNLLEGIANALNPHETRTDKRQRRHKQGPSNALHSYTGLAQA